MTATATGPNPARKGGACFKWKEVYVDADGTIKPIAPTKEGVSGSEEFPKESVEFFRNVWLVKTSSVHVAHWGTYVNTPQVSKLQATVVLEVTIDNDSE